MLRCEFLQIHSPCQLRASQSPRNPIPDRRIAYCSPGRPENDEYPNGRSSVGKRALIALVRFLIIFCIGASATLAWQSYDDPSEMTASSHPQLSWLVPQTEAVPQSAPDAIGPFAPVTVSVSLTPNISTQVHRDCHQPRARRSFQKTS
jgi:hypothetical protein